VAFPAVWQYVTQQGEQFSMLRQELSIAVATMEAEYSTEAGTLRLSTCHVKFAEFDPEGLGFITKADMEQLVFWVFSQFRLDGKTMDELQDRLESEVERSLAFFDSDDDGWVAFEEFELRFEVLRGAVLALNMAVASCRTPPPHARGGVGRIAPVALAPGVLPSASGEDSVRAHPALWWAHLRCCLITGMKDRDTLSVAEAADLFRFIHGTFQRDGDQLTRDEVETFTERLLDVLDLEGEAELGFSKLSRHFSSVAPAWGDKDATTVTAECRVDDVTYQAGMLNMGELYTQFCRLAGDTGCLSVASLEELLLWVFSKAAAADGSPMPATSKEQAVNRATMAIHPTSNGTVAFYRVAGFFEVRHAVSKRLASLRERSLQHLKGRLENAAEFNSKLSALHASWPKEGEQTKVDGYSTWPLAWPAASEVLQAAGFDEEDRQAVKGLCIVGAGKQPSLVWESMAQQLTTMLGPDQLDALRQHGTTRALTC